MKLHGIICIANICITTYKYCITYIQCNSSISQFIPIILYYYIFRMTSYRKVLSDCHRIIYLAINVNFWNKRALINVNNIIAPQFVLQAVWTACYGTSVHGFRFRFNFEFCHTSNKHLAMQTKHIIINNTEKKKHTHTYTLTSERKRVILNRNSCDRSGTNTHMSHRNHRATVPAIGFTIIIVHAQWLSQV